MTGLWSPADQLQDFLLGGWWLESFVLLDEQLGKDDAPGRDDDPDAWIRQAMTQRFWNAPAQGGLW